MNALFENLPVPPPRAPIEQPAGHFWLRAGSVLIEGSAGSGLVHVAGIFPATAADAVATAVAAVSACVQYADGAA